MSDQTVRMPAEAREPASEDSIADGDHHIDSVATRAAAQAQREPVKRALDTGARGWRWLVVSVLLALLPCYVCAAGSSGVTSAPTELAAIAFDASNALVATGRILDMGVRMTTLGEARGYLQKNARAPVMAPHWAEIYFKMLPADTAAANNVSGISIPGQIQGVTLGLNERQGQIRARSRSAM